MRLATLYQYRWLLIRLPILVLAMVTASCLWLLVYPMPPMQLSITTAAADGVYFRHAQAYAERFAAHGVRLTVLPSAGSQQNQDRLRTAVAPSDLAFMQGGFGYLGTTLGGIGQGRSRIETLANVNIEVVWIFSRNRDINALAELQDLRVAMGPPGSGSREIALKLLEQARFDTRNATFSELSGEEAVRAMRQNQIDVVMMVAPPESLIVRNMLNVPGVRLVSLHKSAAITERNPNLESRLLAEGALGNHQPPQDITVLTTSSSLVAREDLHPALKRLATAVAIDVHTAGGLFHRAGDFPSLRRIDFPIAPQSRNTLVHGLPPLERLLPFWWAQLFERILLIVLPVALISVWLMQLVPNYLRWALESRLNRWYGELKFIENDLSQQALSGLDLSRFMSRLTDMDKALLAFACPKELMPRSFTLHQHIEFVRQRLYRMRGR